VLVLLPPLLPPVLSFLVAVAGRCLDLLGLTGTVEASRLEEVAGLILCLESALLFVAAVRLEYPESLAASFATRSVLVSFPKFEAWEERFLAALGSLGGVLASVGPGILSSSE